MLLAVISLAAAAPLQARALGGALIEVQSHGEADLGLRSGPWSAEIFTDTLSLKWAPEGEHGRSWLEVRGAAFAAGLMISPWWDDAPAPEMAMTASYLGLEGGTVRYLPFGLWAGGGAGFKYLTFGGRDETVVPVPGPHVMGGPLAAVGWWTRPVQVAVRGGVDLVQPLETVPGEGQWGLYGPVGAPVEPWIEGEALWRPRWLVAPRVELRGGMASGKGAATAFRLGGSMPYQVPVTGFGWARFWAESYGAARVGVRVGSPDAGPGSGVGAEAVEMPKDAKVRLRGGVVADLALFDAPPQMPGCPPESWDACDLRVTQGQGAFGVGAQLEGRYKHGWAQVEGGYGATSGLAGLDAFTLMVRVGVDWVPLRKPSPG